MKEYDQCDIQTKKSSKWLRIDRNSLSFYLLLNIHETIVKLLIAEKVFRRFLLLLFIRCRLLYFILFLLFLAVLPGAFYFKQNKTENFFCVYFNLVISLANSTFKTKIKLRCDSRAGIFKN